MDDTRANVERDEDEQRLDWEADTDPDTDAKRWVAALTLTGLLATVVLIAALHATAHAGHADRACATDATTDAATAEHALLAAFFASPPQDEAAAAATRACAAGRDRAQTQSSLRWAFPATDTDS